MAERISPEHFHELDKILQKQIQDIIDQIQKEIKRLLEQPEASSGNPDLYTSLTEQILKTKEELAHRDYICSLESVLSKLKKAAQKARNNARNQDLLQDLQDANAELCKCRNIRG